MFNSLLGERRGQCSSSSKIKDLYQTSWNYHCVRKQSANITLKGFVIEPAIASGRLLWACIWHVKTSTLVVDSLRSCLFQRSFMKKVMILVVSACFCFCFRMKFLPQMALTIFTAVGIRQVTHKVSESHVMS